MPPSGNFIKTQLVSAGHKCCTIFRPFLVTRPPRREGNDGGEPPHVVRLCVPKSGEAPWGEIPCFSTCQLNPPTDIEAWVDVWVLWQVGNSIAAFEIVGRFSECDCVGVWGVGECY